MRILLTTSHNRDQILDNEKFTSFVNENVTKEKADFYDKEWAFEMKIFQNEMPATLDLHFFLS